MTIRPSKIGIWLSILMLIAAGFNAVSAQEPWKPVLELRIGEIDGPNALSVVRDVAVAPDGSVYIALPQERVVGHFDPEGRRKASIGGNGEGPGEFRDLLRLGVFDGKLWVVDHRLRRLSYFHPDGRFAESVTWRGLLVPARPLPGDTYSAFVLSTGLSPLGPVELTYNAAGTVQDTLARVPGEYQPLRLRGSVLANPLSLHSLVAYSPDSKYFVYVDRTKPVTRGRGEFTITWIDVASRERVSRGFRYTARDAASTVDEILLQLPPALREDPEIRRELSLHKYLPSVSAVVVGSDHTVWVARERLGQESVRWYNAKRDGSLGGYVILPSSARIVGADQHRIWVLASDGLGVQYISRYRYRGA